MGTTRRELLASSFGASAGLVVGAGSGHAAPAAAALTGVTYLPPSYRGLMWGMSGFVDRLKNAVSEPSAVKLVTSGVQAKADEQLSALRSGSADFMFHTSSYITRSFEILEVIGLPSLVEALYEHGDRLMMESPLWTLINRQLAQSDLFMLSAGGGAAEPEYVWSRERAAATLDDLRGRRCRVVGHEASTALAKFGVVPVRIPSSDTSKALQEGTVDAIVANISTVIGRGLQEHLRSCYKLADHRLRERRLHAQVALGRSRRANPPGALEGGQVVRPERREAPERRGLPEGILAHGEEGRRRGGRPDGARHAALRRRQPGDLELVEEQGGRNGRPPRYRPRSGQGRLSR